MEIHVLELGYIAEYPMTTLMGYHQGNKVNHTDAQWTREPTGAM